MKFLKVILLGMSLILFSASVFAQTDKTIVITAASGTGASQAYLQFLQKAYGEIGYKLILKEYPTARGVMLANKGEIDGLLINISRLTEKNQNLVVVKPHLRQIELVVFTVKENFEVAGRKSLEPYKIGILRGYSLSKKFTEGLQRQIFNDSKTLFSVLKIGRVDIAIAMGMESRRFFSKNPGYESIKALAPPLFVLPLYHLINKKHKALIPKLSPIIQRLLDEGLMTKLYAPYLK